jgi:hypothetical protein
METSAVAIELNVNCSYWGEKLRTQNIYAL